MQSRHGPGSEPERGPLLKVAPERVHLDPEGARLRLREHCRPGGRYRPVDLVLQLEAVPEPWWEELSATGDPAEGQALVFACVGHLIRLVGVVSHEDGGRR